MAEHSITRSVLVNYMDNLDARCSSPRISDLLDWADRALSYFDAGQFVSCEDALRYVQLCEPSESFIYDESTNFLKALAFHNLLN